MCRKHFPGWGVTLVVSLQVAAMTEAAIEAAGNGCGRAGWERIMVPDSILGVWIGMVCHVHDVETNLIWLAAMRKVESGQMTPEEADVWLDAAEYEVDINFDQNLHRAIDALSGWSIILRETRHAIADLYAKVVKWVDVCQVAAAIEALPLVGGEEVATC
jgi:hypothetical protein